MAKPLSLRNPRRRQCSLKEKKPTGSSAPIITNRRNSARMNETWKISVLRTVHTVLHDWQDADLGLANEMAINQFIAHHSVIFQPEKRLMWVSTSPWQCGKYVAYDLNKIFNDTINLQHEIYSSNLTIPADEFTETPEFQHLLTYKKLTPLLLKGEDRRACFKNIRSL